MSQNEPREEETRREILKAIEKVDCLKDLLRRNKDHPDQFEYELDLEVMVYGRTYHHKPVGPYLRLFTYGPGETIIEQGAWVGNYYYIIVEGQVQVLRSDSSGAQEPVTLIHGEQFGARAMFDGGRYRVSVKAPANESVQILRVHRPAIRLLRKLDSYSEQFEGTYQSHGVEASIKDLIWKRGLNQEFKTPLIEASSFRAFAKDHILFHEGAPNEQLLLIIDGWVCRSRQEQDGEITDFLGKGYCLGLESEAGDYRYTATALSRMEVLEINVSRLDETPGLKAELQRALQQYAAPDMQHSVIEHKPPVREEILHAQERLISSGVVDGNNLLVMDMDLCVRCGNCSLACHKVHGRSRLMRRGVHITRIEPMKRRSFQSLLVPSVCMHCNDPECVTGCPTGAISRVQEWRIDIDPDTCIGCGDCATQCPYDAIFMINREEPPAAPLKPFTTRLLSYLAGSREPEAPPVDPRKDLLAVKCNLCSDRATLNPPGSKEPAYSCEENCPTGALARIKPDEFGEIAGIKNLKMLDQKHAYGRNILKADPTKTRIHMICILALIVVVAGVALGLYHYGYGRRVFGVTNMRWATGWAGLVGAFLASSYHWRRQIYDRRRWPLRYWMLTHSYLGVMAGLVLLLHGGKSSGGLLTKTLMVSFDLTILTGLFGLACYQIIPRVLTRIEGTPLLLEDLIGRREELRAELSKMMRESPEALRPLLRKKLTTRGESLRAILHILRQEHFDAFLKSTCGKFGRDIEHLSEEERRIFNEAAQTAALLPRVRAMIYLHRLLGVWVKPHRVFSYLMVALMMVHFLQVVYAWW